MNWDAMGAIAEAAGAIGVIATLLYLATQIRSNTRSVRASSFQEVDRGIREVQVTLVQNPELFRIWNSGLVDFDSLPREEKARFASVLYLNLRGFQNAEYQFEQGTLDQATRADWLDQLRIMCELPGIVTWWERNEAYSFYPTFEQLVSQFVAEGKKPAA